MKENIRHESAPANPEGAKPDFQQWLKETYQLEEPATGKAIWERA
jgi:hypothetical protein